MKSARAHFALLFTNLFFAINLSAVKYLTTAKLAGPFGLNLIRVGVSALLLWLLFLLKPVTAKITIADWQRLFLCALTGIAINQLLFLKGLSLTFPVHAALLMLSTPILIVLINTWALKEKATGKKITGLLLGITGASVLILSNTGVAKRSSIITGDMLILVNAVSYTIYFILVKPLMLKYNPITVTRWIFTIGFFMVLPFAWGEFSQINWPAFTYTGYISLFLLVFTGTFLAYLFNIYGIKHLGAAAAGFYIYTQPVFATIIAMVFLDEKLQLYKIIAAALIFTGVFLTTKKQL